MKESPTIEFKRELTDAVTNEVIAFANTQGGELYIGVNEDGSVIGIEQANQVVETVSSKLHNNIQPNILVHTDVEIVDMDGKDVVKVTVAPGTKRPYHLKKEGLKPSGVFIRYGTSVTNASEEHIRQMLLESDETNSDLTFTEATHIFENLNLKFGSEQQRTLGLITEDGYYTNLALLLSDQCEHTIECISYLGNDQLTIQDRKEFSGSILTQVEQAFEYMNLYNAKASHFEGLQRIEIESFPSSALREALINAVTHRDYNFSSSILVHLFQDRIEFVSAGGLAKGLTVEDIELGISQSRNPKLMNVLYHLKWNESYGTGLNQILESYKQNDCKPSWKIDSNAFVLTLPKQILPTTEGEDKLIEKWLQQQEQFSSKDLISYLNKSKATVRKIIEQLIQSGQVVRVGSGPKTKYQVVRD